MTNIFLALYYSAIESYIITIEKEKYIEEPTKVQGWDFIKFSHSLRNAYKIHN